MTFPWLEDVESEFAERLAGGRMAHALLFSGPEHIGKTALAQRFFAAILCLEKVYPACGACRSCQLAETGAHPDGHLVTFEAHPKTGDLRKELVIDQIRRLTASLFLTTTVSDRKAALIYPAEAMNRNTANALLKTLEEPPGDATLVLVSHNTARLPATIRSRCQALVARQPDPDAANGWLRLEAGVSEHEADLALQAAAGSPLLALRMLEDGSVSAYGRLTETLAGLGGSKGLPFSGPLIDELSDIAPERLWSWLSLQAAARARDAGGAGPAARQLSELQREADRNRALCGTPVRKDLLLQDWLIQWARLIA
jgi:DNA polymerase-3 subunit delta'